MAHQKVGGFTFTGKPPTVVSDDDESPAARRGNGSQTKRSSSSLRNLIGENHSTSLFHVPSETPSESPTNENWLLELPKDTIRALLLVGKPQPKPRSPSLLDMLPDEILDKEVLPYLEIPCQRPHCTTLLSMGSSKFLSFRARYWYRKAYFQEEDVYGSVLDTQSVNSLRDYIMTAGGEVCCSSCAGRSDPPLHSPVTNEHLPSFGSFYSLILRINLFNWHPLPSFIRVSRKIEERTEKKRLKQQLELESVYSQQRDEHLSRRSSVDKTWNGCRTARQRF